MSTEKPSYPLYWPEGWPRTAPHIRGASAFGGSYYNRPSMEKSIQELMRQVRLLKVSEAVLSTNVKRRLDGVPYSGLAQPVDVGAAVFFTLKGREVSLACDKWNRVECNVMAIAKHIEAIRAQERWGVGNVEQAFRGYMALPAPGEGSNSNPWATLGLSLNAGEEQVKESFRLLVKKFHPDNPDTGDAERFRRVKFAYDLIMQNLPQPA